MIIIRTVEPLDLQNFSQEFLGFPRDDSESSEKDDKDKMTRGGNWSERDVAARARCLTVSVAGNDDERHFDREIENWNNFAMT